MHFWKSETPFGKANKRVPTSIPLIDISPLRGRNVKLRNMVAAEIEQACTDTGFFTVVGHGIPLELFQKARQAAEEFFAAPTPVKQDVLRPPEKITRGWNPPNDRALGNTLGKKSPPDLQEAWGMGPPWSGQEEYYTTGAGITFFAPNKWPDIPHYRAIITEYYSAVTQVANNLMEGFAVALGIDPNFFSDKADRPCSNLRIIKYLSQFTEPLEGQLRAGEHTDYGTFTFVKGDNVPGGLQVSNGDGGWYDVETPEDGFVCNIGDTMQLWTGGRFKSTLHRVVNPPQNAAVKDRISIVYFHQPNHDAVLDGIDKTEENTKAPTFAEHYFGKITKANATSSGAGTASGEQLISGGLH
ncbi:MAG: 2-oxoglutarate and iron-dependent oxygenase domain-containing protein [Pseudomonadota bacterium]|nr:2-oxoglutarate and iron-dependent oxygenase domain-containing protein [Pseudomonadota bacterium]